MHQQHCVSKYVRTVVKGSPKYIGEKCWTTIKIAGNIPKNGLLDYSFHFYKHEIEYNFDIVIKTYKILAD